MAKIDPAYGNSSGYFRDPSNGEPLSPDTPRVIPCSLDNGKFVWPQVSFANGDMGKIVYACFTQEEKDLYKAYRGRGTGNEKPKRHTTERTDSSSNNRVGSNNTDVPVDSRYTTLPDGKIIDNETGAFVTKPRTTAPIGHTIGSALSAQSASIVARCDTLLGINNIAGIDYAVLCHSSDVHTLYHIPRQCIPDSEIERLSNHD